MVACARYWGFRNRVAAPPAATPSRVTNRISHLNRTTALHTLRQSSAPSRSESPGSTRERAAGCSAVPPSEDGGSAVSAAWLSLFVIGTLLRVADVVPPLRSSKSDTALLPPAP